MDAKQLLFWRIAFEHLLLACKDAAAVTAVFARVAGQQSLAPLCTGLKGFLRRRYGDRAVWQQQSLL